jgi:hypothetical protein
VQPRLAGGSGSRVSAITSFIASASSSSGSAPAAASSPVAVHPRGRTVTGSRMPLSASPTLTYIATHGSAASSSSGGSTLPHSASTTALPIPPVSFLNSPVRVSLAVSLFFRSHSVSLDFVFQSHSMVFRVPAASPPLYLAAPRLDPPDWPTGSGGT